jgi:hypothetical protein
MIRRREFVGLLAPLGGLISSIDVLLRLQRGSAARSRSSKIADGLPLSGEERSCSGHQRDGPSLEPIRTLARDAFEASRSLTALEQDARHRAAIGKRAPASVPGK